MMDKKYVIDTEENREFLKTMRNGILDFGHGFAAPDGSSYWLDTDGSPRPEEKRETFITGRMAHVYSMGCFLGHEGSRELAAAAIRGLRDGFLHDRVNGGWHDSIDRNGNPLTPKLCYAHAFVILAGTSALLAGIPGAEELLDEAMETYDRYFWDEEEGLSCDIWNTEFSEMDDYRGLNSNMHSTEAFLAVADVLGKEEYRERAGRIIAHVCRWAIDNGWRLPEHYKKDWTPDLDFHKNTPDDPFKPYGATPGHGCEWARLIAQWALSSFAEKEKADMYIAVSEKLFLTAVKDAWNVDGAPGFVYTTDMEGRPIVHDRMHWVLAEAIDTAAYLYRITGKEIYSGYYSEFMKYLDEFVLDHTYGNWFHQLDESNCVIGTVWPGKMDLYHAVQAALIPYYPVGRSICLLVKDGKNRSESQ